MCVRAPEEETTVMKLSKLFLVALAVVLVPAAAFAQTQITGEVTDNTGGVLPGVTVEAASPVLIEGSRVAVTDGSGRYTILGIIAGDYTITMTLPGFSTFVQEGINVPANFTQTVDGQLAVGGIEETVTVSGQSPIVDVQSAARTEVLTRDVIDSLPTPRNTQSIGYLAQGVRLTRPDVGGAQMMEQVRMTSNGANARHTTMQVDGMMVNSQMADGLIMNYNNQALSQEMAISTSGSPAEVQAGGLRLNMIPKDGGNQFSGSAYVGFTLNESWQADNFTDTIRDLGLTSNQGVTNIHDINPAIGGPLVRDKLWFFTSYRDISVDELFPGGFLPTFKSDATPAQLADYFDVGATVSCTSGTTGCTSSHPAVASVRPAVLNQHVKSGLLRLTAQVTPRNKVSAYLDRIFKSKDREFSATREPILASGNRDPAKANYHTAQFKWTSTLSSRSLLEVGYSQVYERLLIGHQPNIPIADGGAGRETRFEPPSDLRTCIRTPCYWDAGYDQTRPWFAETVLGDLSTGRQTRNWWGDIWITPSDRYVPSASFSYVTGSHNFKAGMQYSFGNDGDTRERNGHMNTRPYGGLPQPGSTEDRSRVDVLNYPVSWNTSVFYDAGIYFQDTYTIDRLTINAGLRIDKFKSGTDTFRTGDLNQGRFINARSAPAFDQPPFWTDYNPRFSAVYDLFGDARTALKFSMNKFVRPYASGHAERYSPYRERGDGRDWFDCALNPAMHTAGAAGNTTDCATAAQLGGLAAPASFYLAQNYDGIAQDHEIGLLNNASVFAEGNVAQSGARPSLDLQREYKLGVQREHPARDRAARLDDRGVLSPGVLRHRVAGQPGDHVVQPVDGRRRRALWQLAAVQPDVQRPVGSDGVSERHRTRRGHHQRLVPRVQPRPGDPRVDGLAGCQFGRQPQLLQRLRDKHAGAAPERRDRVWWLDGASDRPGHLRPHRESERREPGGHHPGRRGYPPGWPLLRPECAGDSVPQRLQAVRRVSAAGRLRVQRVAPGLLGRRAGGPLVRSVQLLPERTADAGHDGAAVLAGHQLLRLLDTDRHRHPEALPLRRV